jgi:autotransporter-associated beta strand protein
MVYDGVYRGASILAGYSSGTVRPLSLTLSGPTTFTVADGYADYDLLIGSTSNNRFVPISGTDTPITKRGAGYMYIAGNSTLTGDVTVENGTLHGYVTGSGHQPFGNAANDLKLKRNGILSLSGKGSSSTTVGDLTFSGANAIRHDCGTASISVTFDSLTRFGRATLVLLGTVSGGDYNDWWGSNGSLYVDAWKSATPPNVNGMLPVYLLGAGYTGDNGLGSFAWVADNGRVSRLGSYDGGYQLGEYRRGTIASAGADETVDMTATATLSEDDEVWALRTTENLDAGVSPAPTLTLGSGGLIFNAETTVSPKLRFGSAGDAEAVVFVAGGYGGSAVRTASLAESLTTSAGLTKVGGGKLALTADSSATLSGAHWVNEGTLRLAHASALAAEAEVNIERGATVEIAGNYTLDYVFNGLGSITTGPNLLTATGVLSPGFSVGKLTVEDLLLKGSYVWEYDGTNSDAIACTTLAFGSGASVDCQWLGAGEAAMGSYTIFTYQGADPNVSAVTVAAPAGLQGELSVDSANKRVLLALGEYVERGTMIIVR